MTKPTLLTELTTKAAEATEAMEIIAQLIANRGEFMSIYNEKDGYLVERLVTMKSARYAHFRAPTLLDALRKATAAWESTEKMKAQIKIPKGWRRLRKGVKTRRGDRVYVDGRIFPVVRQGIVTGELAAFRKVRP